MTEQDDPHYRVRRVNVSDDELMVELRNGREIVVSLGTFPALQDASEVERRTWRLLDADTVIEWPSLDLRVSLDDLPPATTTW